MSPGLTPRPTIAGSVTKINGSSVSLQLNFSKIPSASFLDIISCLGTYTWWGTRIGFFLEAKYQNLRTNISCNITENKQTTKKHRGVNIYLI